jgi:hypothetical protein
MLRLELECPDLHICPEKHLQSRRQTQRLTFMALVMKLHFPNHNERSEIRAVLTVVAMPAKFDAMQLFHLSRQYSRSSCSHTSDVES